MGVGYDLYRGRNDFNFPRYWKLMLSISAVLVAISVGSLLTRGLDLSIDFEGGTVWEVPSKSLTQEQAEKTLAPFGASAAEKFQEATTADGLRVLRISGRVDSVEQGTKAAAALAEVAKLPDGDVKVTTVGPSWGKDITRQARLSLIIFLVLIAAYIAWRLEPKMALAAIISVVHDVLLTVGVYSVFQIQVSPATVISFLTILGFSLYDTIVVFDRVQENAIRLGRTGQYTYIAIMRRSLNQVFMRSVNTTFITLLPVVSMLVVGQMVFGQATLGDFSLALLIGLASGAYSSLFVASPLTAYLKEREPRFTEIRTRLVAKGVDVNDTAWHGISTGSMAARRQAPSTAGAGGTATAARTEAPVSQATFGGHPPRPRKKKR
jgi:preprotein translocase subunit SecF